MSRAATHSRPSPHVRRKRLRRRDEILHSALQTFRENGYHGTTLGEIARRLGLQKTAIYHYFPDKEALLYECHHRSLEELERVLAEATSSDGRPSERLARVVREHVRVMTETLEGSPLAFEVQALSPEHQAEVVGRRDAYEKALRELIVAGVEAGEFRPVDPKVVAFAILGAINWIARWYRPGGGLQTPELGAQFAEYLVGGLACHPARGWAG
ncbi:MAG: TetR/AcrR family transcriptional regulator [Gemmatimonadota bacterium]